MGGVFINLQKAFDTMIFYVKNLHSMALEEIVNSSSSLFLSNRQQYVSINGFDSSKLDIQCGVPQVSTLGPLLFLLYINDLRFALKEATDSHFADDTCILYASNKLKSIETVLNCDLKSISDWLKTNRLL